jgi:hypothetical protein
MGAEDWVETVAGSQDHRVWDYICSKPQAQKQRGLLAVTGRDIAENDTLRVDNGLWRLDSMDIRRRRHRRNRRETGRLGDRALEVLAFVNKRAETRAADWLSSASSSGRHAST